MAPRKGHCPCLTVPRMGHPRGGTCLPTDPSSLFLKEVLRRLLDTLPGLKVPHSPPGCLPPLLFLLTPHPSVGRALRHRGEGRLRTLPGPQSEAWVETDQKFIVKYVVHVSTDVATGQNSEPPQACLPTEPPSQVQGEVAGSPRRVRGGGVSGRSTASGPCPHRAPSRRGHRPHLLGGSGVPSGTRIPQSRASAAAAARPEAPAHTRRSVALPAAPALGPGAQGPSARRPPHGRSCAHRAPASPELWGMQARGKGAVRAGRPVRASRPQPGEGSPASRGGRGTHLPSGKSLESSKRPREPGPPSAGGTSAPRTTKTGRTYLFVQRRLHLAASLISGCGLR